MKIFIFIALPLTRRRLHTLRWDSSLNKSSAFFVALFFYTTPLPPFSISGHHLNSDNKKRNWKRKEAAFFWSEFKQHLINIAFVFLEPHFVSFRSKTLLGFISVIRTFLPFCLELLVFWRAKNFNLSSDPIFNFWKGVIVSYLHKQESIF